MVAATGVAADTVRRGRSKAQEATSLGPEARGGRKRAEVHDAQLVAALEALLDSETRGDPMSPLRWTNKSTQALARALTEGGHTVSDFVVRRLLKELGYSVPANAKTTEAPNTRTGTPSSATSTPRCASIWAPGTR